MKLEIPVYYLFDVTNNLVIRWNTLIMKKPFCDWEIDFILLTYPTETLKSIADVLGRHLGGVQYHATRLGLRKSKSALPQQKQCATCKSLKLLDKFPVDRGSLDGRRADCRVCNNNARVASHRASGWQRAYDKNRKRERELKGLCVSCASGLAEPNRKRCLKCLEAARGYAANERKTHANNGLCVGCGEVSVVGTGKSRCEVCLVYQCEIGKRLYGEVRDEVFNAYGNACSCCGETMKMFLSIDHVNNDGAQHRKSQKLTGVQFYKWIKNACYPPSFQILCHNCNHGKFLNGGTCPHKTAALSP